MGAHFSSSCRQDLLALKPDRRQAPARAELVKCVCIPHDGGWGKEDSRLSSHAGSDPSNTLTVVIQIFFADILVMGGPVLDGADGRGMETQCTACSKKNRKK